MRKIFLFKQIFFLSLWCWASPFLFSMTMQLDSLAGVMSQPASSYFLFVYGSSVDFLFEESLFLRAMYIERPQFESQGFREQEAGTFAFLGAPLAQLKFFQMKGWVGYGKMQGWIQGEYLEKKEREGYALRGTTVALDVEARFTGLSMGLRHQVFIGNVDSKDLESYVGWTFGFLLANIGFSW